MWTLHPLPLWRFVFLMVISKLQIMPKSIYLFCSFFFVLWLSFKSIAFILWHHSYAWIKLSVSSTAVILQNCLLIVPSVSCMNFISVFLCYICYAHIDIGSNYPLNLCSYIHWIMLNLVTHLMIPGLFFPSPESYNLHEKLIYFKYPR